MAYGFEFSGRQEGQRQQADYVHARMAYGHLFDSYSLRSFRGLRQCPAAQEHLTRVLSAIAVRRGVTRSASALSCSSPKADRPHSARSGHVGFAPSSPFPSQTRPLKSGPSFSS